MMKGFVLIIFAIACTADASSYEHQYLNKIIFEDPIPTKCPEIDDPNKVVHIAHESDCSLFYKCSNGKPHLQKCPSGLHFNPRAQVCDRPANAGCINNSQPGQSTTPSSTTESTTPSSTTESTTPSSTTESTTTSTTTESTTTSSTTERTTPSTTTESTTPSPGYPTSCPKRDEPFVTINLPHECVCSKYYRCVNGHQILEECASNLHFNPAIHKCDKQENAKCNVAPVPTPIPTPSSTPPVTAPTTPPTTPSSTPSVTAPTTPSSTPTSQTPSGIPSTPSSGIPTQCPKDNSGWTVHLPNETDCTAFYKCDNGKKKLMFCLPGLVYNRLLQVCDWSENVICPTP